LSKITGKESIPTRAVILATVVGVIMIALSQFAPNFFALMVNFTTGGFYISFWFPVIGFAIVYYSGKWVPGPFSFGKKMNVVSGAALIWVTFQFFNISWPRPVYPDSVWLDWSVAIAMIGLAIVGSFIYLYKKDNITIVDADEINRQSESSGR
jgi:amino acid transporter